VECEVDAQLAVGVSLVGGVGLPEGGDGVAECGDQGAYLVLGESLALGGLADGAFGGAPLGLDLGDPLADEGGVGAGLEGGPVGGEAGVAVLELLAVGVLASVGAGVGFAGGGERRAGVVDAVGVEDAGEPLVEALEDGRLAHVDGPRMAPLDVGVLAGEAASVVGAAVSPGALHAAAADAAVHEAGEDVGVLAAWGDDGCSHAGRGAELAGLLEQLVGHERLMHPLGRPDPVVFLVPAHLDLVAEGDVLDVDEDLVAALPVPDLAPGVAGVVEDGAHRELAPGALGGRPVAVAVRVVSGGGGDAVAGEVLGDGEQAGAVDVVGEDAQHDRCCEGIGLQLVESLAVRRLGGVRVGAGVGELVSVRWSAAEVPAFCGGLGGHGPSGRGVGCACVRPCSCRRRST
jgi:hypothetical protein